MMNLLVRASLIIVGLFPGLVLAGQSAKLDHDPLAIVLFWVTLIFSLAILGRFLAKFFNQPGILGELLMGVLLGNLCHLMGLELFTILREGSAVFNIMRNLLSGTPLVEAVSQNISNSYYANQMIQALTNSQGIEFIKVGYVLDILSRYGVIFLLFMVGLESSVAELKHTGREALQVAIIGVFVPIILGFLVAYYLVPQASYQSALFVAATLSATSIGITARVLADLKKLRTREARTILGAAMVDDVLGLVMLAIVSGIVVSGKIEISTIAPLIAAAIFFFIAVLMIGPWALSKVIKCFSFLPKWEAQLVVSFIFVMTMSWLATVANLAAIIGAFAAGLIIHDGYFVSPDKKKQRRFTIKELIAPLEAILAPLFFMLIGIQVKLESFANGQVLLIASSLTAVAIIGKLVSGLGANKKDDGWVIGIGMLPRGEVGLIFASIGRTLGVVSDQLFSAIILMIIITTFIAPPWLKARYAKMKEIAHENNA